MIEAAAFTEGFCSALSDWVTALQDGNTSYQQAIQANGVTMQGVKDALAAYVDDAVALSDTLLDEVRALGTPDVPNGEQVAQALIGGLQRARDLFAQVADDVAALSTSDPTTMTQQLTELTTNMTKASQELSSAFDSIDSPELEAAGKDAASCKQL